MWSRSPSGRKGGLVSADTSAPGPTGDYSKWNSASWAVLIGGLAGAALLIAGDLSTLIQVRVVTVVAQRLSGHSQHDWAVALLGVAAIPLAFGAARRRARPALAGLVLIGAAVMGIALAKDLPDSRSTGVLGQQYDQASAEAGIGFYLETAGAAVLIVTGAAGLILRPLPPRPRARPATAAE